MLEILASAASEVAPAAPKGITMTAEGWVILGTYIFAALFFAIVAIRRAARLRELAPPAPQISAEDAALYAPDRDAPPPPLPSPAFPVGPPPLPPGVLTGTYIAPPPEAVSLPQENQGIFRYFRVKTAIYRKIDLLFIGLVVLIFAGLTTGASGGGEEIPVSEKFKPELLVVSIFFQILLMGMACTFVVRRIHQAEWLGLRWGQWWLVFLIAPVSVFCMWCFMGFLALSGWNGFLERLFDIESMQESVKLLKEAKDPLVIALMSVAAVIVAPVAEEVVFRGYLYPAAKRFCGPVPAIIFSSLVFSAAHANVVALLPLFILAVLLCLAYEFTGSIWANISIHFLFNAATVAIQLLIRYGVIQTP